VTPAFFAFWAKYPRRVARALCGQIWVKKGLDDIADEVMAGLEAQLPEYARRDMDKIPHPSTWLNQERWTDDPAAYSAPKAKPQPTPRCGWHQQPGTANKASKWPQAWCPDCKHCGAKTAVREAAEPQQASSLFAEMAAKGWDVSGGRSSR
jgi:hypothetical protein